MTSQQPPASRRPDLVAFAERILEDWPGWWSFIEAKDVQAIALACGLLERVIVTKPCGEPCHCAEYHAFDGEAVECYRRVDLREATESVVHLLHQSLPLNERHGYCWCSGPDNPALARHLDTCPEQIRQRFEAALKLAAPGRPDLERESRPHCSACGRTDIWDYCDERSCPVRQRDALVSDARFCGGCGGPYQFDTSIPSVLWNRVIRVQGMSEYLCANCILRQFALAGVSFTAELYGADLNGTPIAVEINGAVLTAAVEVNGENNRLRTQLCLALGHLRNIRERPCVMGGEDINDLHAALDVLEECVEVVTVRSDAASLPPQEERA